MTLTLPLSTGARHPVPGWPPSPKAGILGWAMCAKPRGQLRWALQGWALEATPDEMEQEAVDPPVDWSTTPLERLDPRGSAIFNLTLSSADFWLLEQSGNP